MVPALLAWLLGAPLIVIIIIAILM